MSGGSHNDGSWLQHQAVQLVATSFPIMQLSIRDRDAEIKRLADKVESGAESDMSTLTARNESNEAIILSLNEQVGCCS